jgi:putative membrane protein
MQTLANVLVGIVAAVHVLIAVGEIFFWKRPEVYRRLDRFAFNQDEADKVAPIVANVGLYNAFIAAGLIWSFFPISDEQSVKLFFLSCVLIAGIYGAVTIHWKIILIQTLPALVAMISLWIASRAG